MRALFFLSLVACVSDSVTNPDSGNPMDDGGMMGMDGMMSTDQSAPMPLMGKVINQFGEPVAMADVYVGTATTKTMADGTFTLMAPTTYDAIVVVKGTPDRWTLITDLTSKTPVLQARDGAVSGTATGGGNVIDSSLTWPAPNGQRVTTTFSTTDGAAVTENATVLANKTMTTPSFTYGRSATTVTGTAYVFRFTAAATGTLGLPEAPNANTGMLLAGSGTYMAMNGGTASPAVQLNQANQGMNPFSHRSVTVNFTMPAMVNPQEMYALIDVPPDKGRVAIRSTGNSVTNTTFDTPTNVGAAQAQSGAAIRGLHVDRREIWAWEIGKTSSATISLAPPAPLDLTAPPNNMTVPANTMVAWDGTGRTNGFYWASFQCPAQQLDIVTTRTMVTLPQPGGMKLSGLCNWSASAITPAMNTDELVGPTGWMRKTSFDSAPTNGTAAGGAKFKFTAQ